MLDGRLNRRISAHSKRCRSLLCFRLRSWQVSARAETQCFTSFYIPLCGLLHKLPPQMTTEQENTVDALNNSCPGYAVMRIAWQ
jgi:hypothetical protein